MNREEHLEWCKERAMEYVDSGDLQDAWASMASNLGKHDGTKDHPAIMLGMMMLMGGNLSTAKKMKQFILGFN